MAHPKSRISKQRKRKRRTHKKAPIPKVVTCATTGESHLLHHAYYDDELRDAVADFYAEDLQLFSYEFPRA